MIIFSAQNSRYTFMLLSLSLHLSPFIFLPGCSKAGLWKHTRFMNVNLQIDYLAGQWESRSRNVLSHDELMFLCSWMCASILSQDLVAGLIKSCLSKSSLFHDLTEQCRLTLGSITRTYLADQHQKTRAKGRELLRLLHSTLNDYVETAGTFSVFLSEGILKELCLIVAKRSTL